MKNSKNDKELKRDILLKLARELRKHWIFTLIFANLSAVWLPILYTFLGVQLKLIKVVNQSCQFTAFGLIMMIILLAIIIIGNGVLVYEEKTGQRIAKVN